jgi:hypothetical protein
MTEQLLMWSAMTFSERNIYVVFCTFEELNSLRKGLNDANKINGMWDSYLDKIDEEILKRLPEIREGKINEILK